LKYPTLSILVFLLSRCVESPVQVLSLISLPVNLEVFALAFALLQPAADLLNGEAEGARDLLASSSSSFQIAAVGALTRLET
jgi:hypothetical protein